MTSRTLSLELFKGECKRKLWLYLLTAIAALMVPGGLLMTIDRYYLWGMTKRGIAQNLRGIVGIGSYGVLFIIVGVVYASISLAYMFSRSKIDLYHSLPIKKKNMFFVRFLSAFIPFVIIDTFTTVLETLVIMVKGLKGLGVIEIIWNTYIYSLLVFTLGFCIMSIALSISGNLLIGELIGIGLLVGWPIIEEVFNWYRNYCFQTGANYLNTYEFSWWKFLLSPVGACDKLDKLIMAEPLRVLLLVAEVAVLFILSVWLYTIRPSECTGKALCYDFLQPVIRIPIVIMAALTGGIYIVFVSGNFMTAGWYWSVFIIIGVLTHIIMTAVLKMDIKKVFKDWPQLIISMVLAAVIALFYLYDLSGYDRYIPDENKVKATSIVLGSIESEPSVYDIDNDFGDMNIEYADRTKYVLDRMNVGDDHAIRQLAQIGINNLDPDRSVFKRQEKQRELNNMSYEEWVDKYGMDTENYEYVTVKYELNNGHMVYRSYNLPLDEGYAPIEAVFNRTEYKDAIYQADEYIGKNLIDRIEIKDAVYNTVFKMTGTDIDEFLKVYYEDLMNLTLNDLATQYPIYRLSSVRNDEEYSYMDLLGGYYLYPNFDRTLAFLKNKGMTVDKDPNEIEVARIDHMDITDYSWSSEKERKSEISVNGYSESSSYATTAQYEEPTHVNYVSGIDDDIIGQIADVGVIDGFAYVNSILKPYEAGLDIFVTYQTEKGYMNNFYLVIPKGKMPQKLMDDLKTAYDERDTEGMNYYSTYTEGAIID